MKKRVLTTMVALTMTLICCSCGSSGTAEQTQSEVQTTEAQSEETQTEETQTQDSDDSILYEIAVANHLDTLAENHGRVSVIMHGVCKDGNEYTQYYYKDAERYVSVFEEDVYIDDNGDVYGFLSSENLVYRILFIDDYYEEYKSVNEISDLCYYVDCEKVISQKTENGVITIEARFSKDVDPRLCEMYGYTLDDVDYYKNVYELDESTKEIIHSKIYMVKGEQETFVWELTPNFDCETYVVDEKLTEGVFGKDIRTMTVIANPGTDEEKTYTSTVKKGTGIYVIMSSEYEQNYYLDKECTQKYTGEGIDETMDVTVYIKKAE